MYSSEGGGYRRDKRFATYWTAGIVLKAFGEAVETKEVSARMARYRRAAHFIAYEAVEEFTFFFIVEFVSGKATSPGHTRLVKHNQKLTIGSVLIRYVVRMISLSINIKKKKKHCQSM